MRRLYDRCAPMLMGIASRYIPDHSDAQDVLQASFISIFKKLDKFEYRGPGSLIGWMKRIAANTSINWLRQNKRLRFASLSEDLIDESGTEETPFRSVSQDDVFNAIRALPDGYRTVLNLYVFEDLSHKEIAALLGISEGTSASQLHRAKALLWKMIKSKMQ